MEIGFVYIIKSLKSDTYYIGSSKDPEKRLIEHNNGKTVSTKHKGPWKLVLTQSYPTILKARQIELKLKKLKRRDYIEKIVEEKIIKIK